MERTTHIDESIPGGWASARNTLLLAVGLNRTEALCADGLLIRHRAEVRSEFCNQVASQSTTAVVAIVGGGGGGVAVVRRGGRWCWCWCWCWGWCWGRGRGRDITSLIKSGGLEREGGRDTRAAFTRAVQVLERDDGGRDSSLLVLNGVSKWEVNLDRGVVERMTKLGIAGQSLDA